ncbi:hypothetical protein BUALT_Bualt07G0096800 [Buddleja alternifolia]|uniref:CASP-like protein n=1 Tax=Buddleja alternifolia TaxID=168488 RepID=A0AAV6XHM1_9LAMI|nr:hypothetical protein BUALT_Bualt07G0096800 [Buddleja alternifolia]
MSSRYVFATGAIGFVYTLIQIPFAMYNVVKEKRWIRVCNNTISTETRYLIFLEGMAFLLASAVGVGFGVTIELKRAFGDRFDDKAKKFLNNGNISTGLLLVGFVLMALLSIFLY